mmetsp:Transcript_3667/g.9924  ORF Transcript_3667/g.9924 Transcript_3667/m.9924 type:complete len:109 (-) Transcript_3667:826-1152(-)
MGQAARAKLRAAMRAAHDKLSPSGSSLHRDGLFLRTIALHAVKASKGTDLLAVSGDAGEESFCYNIYKAATTRVPATSQTANLFLHCLPTIDAVDQILVPSALQSEHT